MKTLQEIKQLPNFLVNETSYDGGFGILYQRGKPFATVIWSNGAGWEHISMTPLKRSYTPSWDEMCHLKDMFFYDDEVVVQYHPAKSEYVNNVANCLHLWRPIDAEMPTPNSILVGLKSVTL